MFTKKILVSALFAAGMIGAVATPLSSVAAIDIQVNVAPPADRYEVVPQPRQGYIWAPGHWQWNANRHRHFWTNGYWERERPGFAFQRPQWIERDGRWHYQARRWDSDHDGIPNHRDPTPYGANRSRARDSDRDGIPNYRDPTPYGANRSRAKDSDRDGIPDYRDPTPYGGVRRGDRDGDGVPDNRDRFPSNPNRS